PRRSDWIPVPLAPQVSSHAELLIELPAEARDLHHAEMMAMAIGIRAPVDLGRKVYAERRLADGVEDRDRQRGFPLAVAERVLGGRDLHRRKHRELQRRVRRGEL